RHGAHCAAHGQTAREAGPGPRGDAVRDVRDPASAHASERREPAADLGAAADKFGWDARPSPSRGKAKGALLTGRGIAYTYRNNTIVATIAEVDVNRETGRVWVKRLVCAHDCGLTVNPLGLQRTIECGMLHGLSRALWEEVQFDAEKVTS